MSPTPILRGLLLVLVLAIAACGGNDAATTAPGGDTDLDLDGESIALESGCAACHGSDFAGGIAPTWRGLYGSTVTLSDGSTVTADEAYLVEAIKDPSARIVDGYNDVMPDNRLSDAQVDAIVEFIASL